VNTSEVLHLEH
jgi:hypothetical protein